MPYKDPEKRREQKRRWFQKNKERIKAHKAEHKEEISVKRKEHYKKNKEKIKQQCRNYYLSHKEKCASYQKKYYDKYKTEHPYVTRRPYIRKHKDRDRARSKIYYKNNKDKISEQYKIYRKNNMDAMRAKKRKRRAIVSKVKEHYTKQDESFTLNLFCHKCFNCGSKEKLVIDHVYPLSKGYALSRNNACVLCNSCNCSKSNHMPEDFFTEDKLKELFILLGIVEKPIPVTLSYHSHSAFPEACDSLTCSCL